TAIAHVLAGPPALFSRRREPTRPNVLRTECLRTCRRVHGRPRMGRQRPWPTRHRRPRRRDGRSAMTELNPLDSGFMELEDTDRHVSVGIGAVAIVAGPPP